MELNRDPGEVPDLELLELLELACYRDDFDIEMYGLQKYSGVFRRLS